MTSFRNRMLVIAAVALAAICASTVPAAGQGVIQGSFTLPCEVRWQAWTLPAGDYTFKMASMATPNIITLTGPNGSAFVPATVADKSDVSEQSSLTIEHRYGGAIVRELYLAQIGVRLRYNVHKAPKDVELAQGPVATEQVLVAMR